MLTGGEVAVGDRIVDLYSRISWRRDHSQPHWNREGPKCARSYPGELPKTSLVMICAVMGASRMPSRRWPVATKYPEVEVSPRMGRSSGVPGRSPAQASCTLDSDSPGASSIAA